MLLPNPVGVVVLKHTVFLSAICYAGKIQFFKLAQSPVEVVLGGWEQVKTYSNEGLDKLYHFSKLCRTNINIASQLHNVCLKKVEDFQLLAVSEIL